jgi:elongation factor Tu
MSHRRFRASLELLPTSSGGRSGAIAAGYRGLLRFEASDADFGAEVDIVSEVLAPGQTDSVELTVWAGEDLPAVPPGTRFEVREGTRIVGHGTITEERLS